MPTTWTGSGFEVLPGDADSGVVVHVPHASRVVPPRARASIVLDDAALERELDAMTDAGTDRLAAAATSRLERGPRPWRFVNRLSRLVVDPERFADAEREEMAEVGMGAVYTATSTRGTLREPDAERDAAYTRTWFTPYADALADLVDQRLAASGGCTLLDLHSYPLDPLPYERHPADRRPEVCLGTDATHTPPALLAAASDAFVAAGVAPGEVVADEPFRGTYVPMRHYRRERRVRSLMIELRRDTYADPAGRARIVAALAALIQAPTLAP